VSIAVIKIFLLNFAVTLVGYIFFINKLSVSKLQQRVIFVSFLVAPVFLVIKGVASAIYVIDIISPILFWYAIKACFRLPAVSRSAVFLLVLLMVLLPMFGTLANYLLYGSDSLQFTGRNLLALSIWIYRNFIFLAVFVIATGQQISVEAFTVQLKCILLLSIGISILGLINYAGVIDLDVYYMMTAAKSLESTYYATKTAIGSGFLGMFRGSVGQYYANIFCLCIPFVLDTRGRWRWLAIFLGIISLVLILCSLSRAGMIGVMVSVVMMMYMMGFRGVRLILPVALACLLLLPILQLDLIQERIGSIGSYVGSSKANRVDGWLLALQYFSNDFMAFVFGNGAANRQGVAKVIGAYGAHNEYLDVIFRTGFLGLICLMTLLYLLWHKMARKRKVSNDSQERVWLAVIPAILVSNMVMGGTQDHLCREYSGYAAGILMFYLYGLGLAVQPRILFNNGQNS
jgi:hypothetical protein